jgi:DNA-binding NarL/FixJ family response regulator
MLVDDHAVVREGYRRLLSLEPDMRVVAEAADADSAFVILQRQPTLVDVMVMDLSMPGRSGLDLLKRVHAHWPGLQVLVFSMHDGPAMVRQAMAAGAVGYVTKSSPPDDLVNAVRYAALGQTVLSSDVADAVQPGAEPAPHLALSAREFDVLRYLLEGLTLEQIAERLHLSVKTVANYQTLVRQRLGVGNAVELLRYAQQHGLIGA